jgi:hypothetical protein
MGGYESAVSAFRDAKSAMEISDTLPMSVEKMEVLLLLAEKYGVDLVVTSKDRLRATLGEPDSPRAAYFRH